MASFLALASLIVPTLGLVRPDDVGRLPALGWNSWNAYSCNVSETKILAAANALVNLGLKDAGYEYVNIDDCWSVKTGRDNVTNQILPDYTKFPSGINGTAAQIHALGLKAGIYSSAGLETCGGYPASLYYEDLDASVFASWGIDYLKYDNCGVPSNWTDTYTFCVPDTSDGTSFPNGSCAGQTGLAPDGYDWSLSNTSERYRRMRDALLGVEDEQVILFSLCDWGQADVIAWGNETGNSWRMSGDITPYWTRVAEILNENSFLLNSVNFWGHNDPDMLEIGNGNLTLQESRSHFAFWAAMKSPLIIGTNLDNLSTELVDILKNPYLLAFSQDSSFGQPAVPYKWGVNPDWTFNATNPAEYWSGASTNGALVLVLNTLDTTVNKTASWAEVPQLDANGTYQVTDIWTGNDLGCVSSGYSVSVQSHDTAGFLVQECTS